MTWTDPTMAMADLEHRVGLLEDTIRVLLTQNHLGEKLPYAEYRRLWDALPPSTASNQPASSADPGACAPLSKEQQ